MRVYHWLLQIQVTVHFPAVIPCPLSTPTADFWTNQWQLLQLLQTAKVTALQDSTAPGTAAAGTVHQFKTNAFCITYFLSAVQCSAVQCSAVHLQSVFNLCVTFAQRGTRFCWAWYKHNLETNKLTMFLETEAAFPYCNWSIKMARINWFCSTSFDIGPAYVNSWKRLVVFLFEFK